MGIKIVKTFIYELHLYTHRINQKVNKMYTKKDFENTARMLSTCRRNGIDVDELEASYTEMYKKSNPHFNEVRFKKASRV